MNVDPKNLKWRTETDLFFQRVTQHLHYTVYLQKKDLYQKEDIKTFRNVNSYLQGHPDMNKVPGVDMSTGSLGQGVSAAGGMALCRKA